MNDLTVTEGYMLLVLNRKGRFSMFKIEENICLFISGILELLLNDYISIKDDTNIIINKELTEKYKYLEPLYNTIKNSKEEITMKKLAERYMTSLKKKKLTEYFDAVGTSLIQKDYAKKIRTSSVFGAKIGYLPYEKCIKDLTTEITQEVLMKDNMDNDYAIILGLIKSSGHLYDHFSKIETDKLGILFKDIEKNAKYIRYKELLDYIDDTIDLIISCSIV